VAKKRKFFQDVCFSPGILLLNLQQGLKMNAVFKLMTFPEAQRNKTIVRAGKHFFFNFSHFEFVFGLLSFPAATRVKVIPRKDFVPSYFVRGYI
jgi:hypothetical protein